MAVLSHAESMAAQREKTAVLTVLLIDPQPETRSLLKSSMRSVETVKTVREAGTLAAVPQILAESKPHVMFIDEAASGAGDIFEVVGKIKAHPASKGMGFVLMSGNLNTEMRQKGMEVGILGYLSKPFDVLGIEAALRDARGKVATNHQEILNRLRKIAFFSGFKDLELVRLLKICQTKKLGPGEVLFKEGEQGDRMYVLVAGKVDIIKERDEGPEVLVTMQPGNVFGEMAIVDSEPRSADARAKDGAIVMEINAQIMADENDILALKIYRKLAILVTKKLRNYTK